MIRKLIEKRRLKKLKVDIFDRIDKDIDDLLNDLTKDISDEDTLLTVSELRSLINYKKNVMMDLYKVNAFFFFAYLTQAIMKTN